MEALFEGGSLLKLSGSLMVWTFIAFGVLVFVLGKFGWAPIIKALDNRRNKIKEDMEAAEANRKKSEEILAQQKEQLSKARSEADQFIAKAKTEAEEVKAEIEKKANAEAANIIDKAKEAVEIAKTKALEDIKSEIGNISVDIASKLIGKALSAKDHEELILNSLKQYQNLN